eukprot:FR742126.1.p1 GENE.FR742126.1~~FR742126.1.p1  ORF type:complete len:193 (+),score=27.19 FR742126.1:2-580(+)
MVSVPDAPVVTTGGPQFQQKSEPQELPANSEVQKLEKGTTMDEGVDEHDLISCCGLFCVLCNIYTKFPACLGCHSKGQLICMEIESVMCKVGVNEGSLCMCCKGEVECLKPTTCIKMSEQCFCIDMRCAFPCDDEVPCILTILGCTLVRDCTCICKGFDKLANKDEDKGGAPAEQVLDAEVEEGVVMNQMQR